MLSYGLNQQAERTVEFASGGSLTYRAVTKTSFDAAKAAARKQKTEITGDPARMTSMGIDPVHDVKSPEVMDALYTGLLVGELGARHAIKWTGVADICGTKAAECTPENVRKFLTNPMPAQEFLTDVFASLLPEALIKKGSGTDAPGSSAAVPSTAPAAESSTLLATQQGAEKTGSSAPSSNSN